MGYGQQRQRDHSQVCLLFAVASASLFVQARGHRPAALDGSSLQPYSSFVDAGVDLVAPEAAVASGPEDADDAPPADPASAPSRGLPSCPCISIDPGDRRTDNGVELTFNGTNVIYNNDVVAGECGAWDKGLNPGGNCDGPAPQSWCSKQWCFVDPCKCDVGRKLSLLFGDTEEVKPNGHPLVVSYETCGGKSDVNFIGPDCGRKETPEDCATLEGCKWEVWEHAEKGRCHTLSYTCAAEIVVNPLMQVGKGYMNVGPVTFTGEPPENIMINPQSIQCPLKQAHFSAIIDPSEGEDKRWLMSYGPHWDQGFSVGIEDGQLKCSVNEQSITVGSVPNDKKTRVVAEWNGTLLVCTAGEDTENLTTTVEEVPCEDSLWLGGEQGDGGQYWFIGNMEKIMFSSDADEVEMMHQALQKMKEEEAAEALAEQERKKRVADDQKAREQSAGKAKASAGPGGSKNCPCITPPTSDISVNGKDVSYPLTDQCEAYDDTRAPGECENPSQLPGQGNGWCSLQWCYVDPCNCDPSFKVGLSAYMPPEVNYKGKPMYFSYETCGTSQADASLYVNPASCKFQKDAGRCRSTAGCTWFTDGGCVGDVAADACDPSSSSSQGAQKAQNDQMLDPGCYLRAPDGCPKLPKFGQEWTLDPSNNQTGHDQTACEQRVPTFAAECGSNTVESKFVKAPVQVLTYEQGAKPARDANKPSQPGCYWRVHVGCENSTASGSLLQAPQDDAQSDGGDSDNALPKEKLEQVMGQLLKAIVMQEAQQQNGAASATQRNGAASATSDQRSGNAASDGTRLLDSASDGGNDPKDVFTAPSGFPSELMPFYLFDIGMDVSKFKLTTQDGRKRLVFDEADEGEGLLVSAEAEVNSQMSSLFPGALKFAFAYPDASKAALLWEGGMDIPPRMMFLRTGGYVFLGEADNIVAVSGLAPPNMLLKFGKRIDCESCGLDFHGCSAPDGAKQDFQEITIDFLKQDATHFCWFPPGECKFAGAVEGPGCFAYKKKDQDGFFMFQVSPVQAAGEWPQALGPFLMVPSSAPSWKSQAGDKLSGSSPLTLPLEVRLEVGIPADSTSFAWGYPSEQLPLGGFLYSKDGKTNPKAIVPTLTKVSFGAPVDGSADHCDFWNPVTLPPEVLPGAQEFCWSAAVASFNYRMKDGTIIHFPVSNWGKEEQTTGSGNTATTDSSQWREWKRLDGAGEDSKKCEAAVHEISSALTCKFSMRVQTVFIPRAASNQESLDGQWITRDGVPVTIVDNTITDEKNGVQRKIKLSTLPDGKIQMTMPEGNTFDAELKDGALVWKEDGDIWQRQGAALPAEELAKQKALQKEADAQAEQLQQRLRMEMQREEELMGALNGEKAREQVMMAAEQAARRKTLEAANRAKEECTWTEHHDQTATMLTASSHRSMKDAFEECVFSGIACKAVTCRPDGLCTLLASTDLLPSEIGEITYIPSDGCFKAAANMTYPGHPDCPCIAVGMEDPSDTGMGALQAVEVEGRTVQYPFLRAQCQAWDNGHYPGRCEHGGQSPGKDSGFCGQKWCYVDACNCKLTIPPARSAYLKAAVHNGRPLFYSYATCGGQTVQTAASEAVCETLDSADACSHNSACAWTGASCLRKDLASMCGVSSGDANTPDLTVSKTTVRTKTQSMVLPQSAGADAGEKVTLSKTKVKKVTTSVGPADGAQDTADDGSGSVGGTQVTVKKTLGKAVTKSFSKPGQGSVSVSKAKAKSTTVKVKMPAQSGQDADSAPEQDQDQQTQDAAPDQEDQATQDQQEQDAAPAQPDDQASQYDAAPDQQNQDAAPDQAQDAQQYQQSQSGGPDDQDAPPEQGNPLANQMQQDGADQSQYEDAAPNAQDAAAQPRYAPVPQPPRVYQDAPQEQGNPPAQYAPVDPPPRVYQDAPPDQGNPPAQYAPVDPPPPVYQDAAPVQPMQYATPVQPMQYAPPVQPMQYAPPVQPMQYAPPVQPMQPYRLTPVADQYQPLDQYMYQPLVPGRGPPVEQLPLNQGADVVGVPLVPPDGVNQVYATEVVGATPIDQSAPLDIYASAPAPSEPDSEVQETTHIQQRRQQAPVQYQRQQTPVQHQRQQAQTPQRMQQPPIQQQRGSVVQQRQQAPAPRPVIGQSSPVVLILPGQGRDQR